MLLSEVGYGQQFAETRRYRGSAAVKTLGNLLWFFLAGLWLSISYVLVGALAAIFVVTLPMTVASFRLAHYALWPFGRIPVKDPYRTKALSGLANIIWFPLGLLLALAHMLTGALLCLTIVGIPLGIADFKMARLGLSPFGKIIIRAHDVQQAAALASVPALGGAPTT